MKCLALAVLPLIYYPDPRLSQPCDTVTEFDDALAQFATDLAETMAAAPGVGITAAHVGRLIRLVVLRLDGDPLPTVYVNPKLIGLDGPATRHIEGSISMPGFTEEVERPSRIRISFQDLQGNHHEAEAEGFRAICLQHEIDQLDGIFWLRRLSRLKRERLIKRWEKRRS